MIFLWIAGFKNSYLFLFHLEVQVISGLMINEQIRDREVRVIGQDGEQLGIMSAKEAYLMARDADLDLVKIAPTAKPPVCKIINYGKYRYEQARKEKEAKRKQRTIEVKEIRLSPNIDMNDLDSLMKCLDMFSPEDLNAILREITKVRQARDAGQEIENTEDEVIKQTDETKEDREKED